MKVIIITGATGGLGAATSRYFLDKGWEVVGTSRTDDAYWRLDLTSIAACEAFVLNVLDRYGRIDALFNNAGFAQIGGFEEFDQAAHQAIFETNVFGAMRLSAAVLPTMRKQGYGTLIHMGSVVGYLPAPFMGSYSASKHALEGFAKSLDHELRGSGLRSVLVRAGFMRSRIAENTAYSKVGTISVGRDAVHRSIENSLSKADDPMEVARTVLKACSVKHSPSILTAGREAHNLARLSRYLPSRIFEKAFREQFGLTP